MKKKRTKFKKFMDLLISKIYLYSFHHARWFEKYSYDELCEQAIIILNTDKKRKEILYRWGYMAALENGNNRLCKYWWKYDAHDYANEILIEAQWDLDKLKGAA